MNEIKKGPFLKHLDELELKCKSEFLTLSELFLVFGSDGHYILILFLILPFLQPIPLLGLSTPFGLLIAVVALFAFLGKPPFVPGIWKNKNVSSTTVLKIVETSEKIFRKISFALHPRWAIFFGHGFQQLNTSLFVFNAIILALPLPIPFTNTMPAIAIFLSTLGYLEEDGLFILLSYLQTIISLVFFALIYKGVALGIANYF